MYNLVVVDMQIGFHSTNEEWLITNVEERIHKAVVDDANIIFIEFLGYDRTHKRLLDACKGYEKQWLVYKDGDDGGSIVVSLVKHAHLDASAFYYVGVNLCACVLDTTKTLVHYFKSSQHFLHKNGCNTCSTCNKEEDLREFKHLEVIE